MQALKERDYCLADHSDMNQKPSVLSELTELQVRVRGNFNLFSYPVDNAFGLVPFGLCHRLDCLIRVSFEDGTGPRSSARGLGRLSLAQCDLDSQTLKLGDASMADSPSMFFVFSSPPAIVCAHDHSPRNATPF